MVGDVIAGNAENGRQLAFRHIESAKCKIEKWKGGSEILVSSLISIGVVPTVKDRAGDSIAEWAKSPVQVRVHQPRVKRIERHKNEECFSTESEEADKQIDEGRIENEVDGMYSHRGQPINSRWSMMNAMEAP